MIEQPGFIESDEELNKHLEFLDNLRESGVTNMYGAGGYIRDAFDVSRKESSEILAYWMKTFTERHPA